MLELVGLGSVINGAYPAQFLFLFQSLLPDSHYGLVIFQSLIYLYFHCYLYEPRLLKRKCRTMEFAIFLHLLSDPNTIKIYHGHLKIYRYFLKLLTKYIKNQIFQVSFVTTHTCFIIYHLHVTPYFQNIECLNKIFILNFALFSQLGFIFEKKQIKNM